MRTPQPEPSEWQIEEKTGKRYRMIGNVKEYEMLVTIGGISVPESQVEAFNARNKAAAEARREAERKAAEEQPPQRNCPFKDGMHTTCTGEKCAFYFTGCTLAQIGAPARDTAGRVCPFDRYGHKCREDCALYNGGTCSIMRLIECTRKDQK